MWFFVKEYLMPYWYKLLQTEIFPQNASLLFFWSSLFNSSGYAITKTGRFILDNFNVSAIPFSSPKFGRTTKKPSIISSFFLNSFEHFCASS